MRFAKQEASDELGDLTDERLNCLDIGVQCGIAATLDLLGIRLRRVPVGDGSTSIAWGFVVDGPGAWPREPLPGEATRRVELRKGLIMSDGRGVRAVQNFWNRVWSSQNPDAVDELVVEDFLLVSGGVEIRSRQAFKQWVIEFLSVINDLEFEEQDSFQNADGTRVVSMWHLAGTNNGVLGTEPKGQPIEMVGIAVWEVREDGMLISNRVERNAWELYRKLTGE